MKYIIIISLLMLQASVFGQGFMKTFGGNGYDEGIDMVRKGNDYLIIGNTGSFGAGSSDVFFLKLDSSGNKLINKLYGGAGIDKVSAMDIDSLGNLYLVGTSGSGDYDLVCYKLDSAGNLIKTKTFSNPAWEFGKEIIVRDSLLYVYGTTDESGGNDHLVLILDHELNLINRKVIAVPGDQVPGTIGFHNDSLLILGSTDSVFVVPHIIRMSESLQGMMISQFSFPASVHFESFDNMNDTGYVVGGWQTDSINSEDVFIARYDINSNLVWQQVYGGSGIQKIYDIESLDDGRFFFGAVTNSAGLGLNDAYLVILHSSGYPSFECTGYCTSTFGGPDNDEVRSIIWTGDGFAALGTSYSFGPGVSAAWFIRGNRDLFAVTDNEAVMGIREQGSEASVYFNYQLNMFEFPRGAQIRSSLIYDVSGRVVSSGDITGLNCGTYIGSFFMMDGSSTAVKFTLH